MSLTDFRAALLRDDFTFAETLAFIAENYDYQQQAFVNLRRGRAGLVPPPIDDIEAFWEPHEKAGVAQALACAVVGSRDTVRKGIADFIQRHRPDELMLTANIFDHDKRLRSFQIAAEVMA